MAAEALVSLLVALSRGRVAVSRCSVPAVDPEPLSSPSLDELAAALPSAGAVSATWPTRQAGIEQLGFVVKGDPDRVAEGALSRHLHQRVGRPVKVDAWVEDGASTWHVLAIVEVEGS